MPWSSSEGKDAALIWIRRIAPGSTLDVGTGAGYWGDALKQIRHEPFVVGIEAWEPYVDRFDLNSKYTLLSVEDARDSTLFVNRVWDLIIFGDVLEHMPEDDARSLIQIAVANSRYVLISLPIVEWPQDAAEGNPFEAHVAHWSDEKIRSLGLNIVESSTGEKVGAYLVRGDRGYTNDPYA